MVDPVPVLQHHRDWPAPGQPVEQLVHREEDLPAQCLGIEELHSRLMLAGHLQRQHHGQVREPLVGARSEQIARRLLELGPGLASVSPGSMPKQPFTISMNGQ